MNFHRIFKEQRGRCH